jgi:hypothetical protein
MKQSWISHKSFFPLLLCFMLVLHLAFLAIKFSGLQQRKHSEQGKKKAEKTFVVKIDPRAFKLKKQIVQSEDGGVEAVVKGAYLSDKTRAFDRQTRARRNDIFAAGRPGGGARKVAKKKELKLSDLGAHAREDPFKKAAEDYTHAKNYGPGPEGQRRQISSTNDHVEDIPLGDMTNMNTVEYKYYGFYHRIRQRLEQFWGRSIQEKAAHLAKNGRRVPASDELITALVITLDDHGEIVAIKVKGTSGIKELDDAAIESFNDAGPFPNPPKDLVVDGKVTLEWGFVVRS